jgi:ribose transport system permease protein
MVSSDREKSTAGETGLSARRNPDWSWVLLLIYGACIYTVQPAFFSPGNLWTLLYYTCLLIPAVLGVHILIVLGLFDLSVGSVAALSGVVAAKAIASGTSLPLGLSLGLLIGVSLGALNWFLVVKCRISALIATLITLGIARAISLGITQGQSIGGLPQRLAALALGLPGSSIPPAIVLGIGLICLVELLTHWHVLFRRLYHVGSNPAAAASSGISVDAIRLFGFAISGAGAAVVGLMQSSRTLSASPFLFPDLALDCIAACVIGGASLNGGTGRATGASFGMLMVVISRNLVVMARVDVYWQDLGIALILLAAVLLRGGENGIGLMLRRRRQGLSL